MQTLDALPEQLSLPGQPRDRPDFSDRDLKRPVSQSVWKYLLGKRHGRAKLVAAGRHICGNEQYVGVRGEVIFEGPDLKEDVQS